jgi:hypothetical protein
LAERDAAPSAQEAFAEDMGYNGSVTNARIPPDTEKRIGFTPTSASASSISTTAISRRTTPR